MKDIAIVVLIIVAFQFIDLDKNAIKAVITGGVAGFYLARRFFR